MKQIIKVVLLLGLLALAFPSYALWQCQATNTQLRGSGYWFWNSNSLKQAQTNALAACNAATSTKTGGTFCHRTPTCYLMQCGKPVMKPRTFVAPMVVTPVVVGPPVVRPVLFIGPVN